MTESELLLGEGYLGTRNLRRFPLHVLARVDLEPSPGDQIAGRNMRLRFVWADGQILEVDGIGPIAAQHFQALIHALGIVKHG